MDQMSDTSSTKEPEESKYCTPVKAQDSDGAMRTYHGPYTLRPAFTSDFTQSARASPSAIRHYRAQSRSRGYAYSPYSVRGASTPFDSRTSFVPASGYFGFQQTYPHGSPFHVRQDNLDNDNRTSFVPASGGFGFQQTYSYGSPFHARQHDLDNDNRTSFVPASGGFGFQQGYSHGSPFHAREDDMDDDDDDDDDDEEEAAETERLLYYRAYLEHTVPVESAPVESAPVESAPVESAPVESAPVESAPVTRGIGRNIADLLNDTNEDPGTSYRGDKKPSAENYGPMEE